jgi:hypothetical protein
MGTIKLDSVHPRLLCSAAVDVRPSHAEIAVRAFPGLRMMSFGGQ